MIFRTETSGDDAAEEWFTSDNWEEDLAITTERRRTDKVKNCETKNYEILLTMKIS